MRIKTIVNCSGELQKGRIELFLNVSGGDLGLHAVQGLMTIIKEFENIKTPEEITTYRHIVCGYAACCLRCGFLTERSADDLMHAVKMMVDFMLANAEEEK